MPPENLEQHDLIVIAGKAHVDPRTVDSYLQGRKVMHLSREAIERALRDLGWTQLVRAA